MNRRQILAAAPAFGLASLLASGAAPIDAEILEPEIVEVPFLAELTRPALGLEPGDMVLIVPGVPKWDDRCLLRDGTFAAVTVFALDNRVWITRDGEESFDVSREEAKALIRGRVDRKLRVSAGTWAA